MKLFSNGFNRKYLHKKNLQFGKWRWEGRDNCWERIYSILLPCFFFFLLLSAGEFLSPSQGGAGQVSPETPLSFDLPSGKRHLELSCCFLVGLPPTVCGMQSLQFGLHKKPEQADRSPSPLQVTKKRQVVVKKKGTVEMKGETAAWGEAQPALQGVSGVSLTHPEP